MNPSVRAWAPALVWAVVLFSLSSRSTLPGNLDGGLDKVAHFGAFAVLGVLLAHGGRTMRLATGWTILIGLVYAATDEIHQYFVPGRSPDPADWIADSLGVATGCLLLYRLRADRPRHRPVADDITPDSVSR